ncbi:MAG: hypothetical protein A2845_06095 [Candidatus Lloydbacteria bacterium RIFCSPHIGHO2_01_FULL_49_22]|uniref:Uncharacterized protein n=1 Tax=Candidatus Lloydbacteria bacterium RIFCSPHIGHO2_01_FULL_49_22 TaxID=1798658 RepID=A0A1G2D0P8_9BACT|nr:MAG: hypothetical protein A2845_06095 [Candidatus Lloydbacteria bacterium RIFCSPHIGHO2_01_FULL_49_22]OGZ08815.1 MAG: hypothetical protein A3C14_01105 [Candidatus Lloydbacteria bacterium RIFCSPHIGHO2_02_FULL_50_18]
MVVEEIHEENAMSRWSFLSAIAAACFVSAGESHSHSLIYLANSITPNQSPPEKGRGNAVARRMAQKRRNQLKSRMVARRRR